MKNIKVLKVSSFKIYILFILLTVFGVFISLKLTVILNPSSILPSITINYSWANASPYTIERDVTSILEAGFSTLKGLSKIDSKSYKGNGFITLGFDKHANIDNARFEVATVIRQLYKKLPEQTSYPKISVNRPDEENARAFLSYSIKANTNPFNIRENVTNQIEPIIGAIQGVDKTQVHGATSKEYVLFFDNSIFKTLKLTKQDVIQALKNSFNKETLGSVNYNDKFISLTLQPTTQELNWHLSIIKIKDRIIYLDEITTIREQEQETQYYYRINGDNAITLNIFATKQANTITLVSTIESTLEKIKNNLPKGYNIIKTYDSTDYLKDELDKIYERSFYTVFILLLFILLVSKSFKYLFVTLISLIANISSAFLLYYLFKVEIQLYSLAGITISLGLIIDNSVVMIDHIRHQHNKSVFVPILASTLTTIGALAVIYFLDDKYKKNLIDFALVIIINLTVSLFIALYLIPGFIRKNKISCKKREALE